MKHFINTIIGTGVVVVLSSCVTRDASLYRDGPAYYYAEPASVLNHPSGPSSGEFPDSVWPRFAVHGSTTNIIYEPQGDSWDGHRFIGRTAVGIQSAGQLRPTYGVITVQAFTLVDKTKRTVSLRSIQILGGDFPSARQKTQEYIGSLREAFPSRIEGLSLDSLENSIAVVPQQLRGSNQPLNNLPPKIIFSTQPAILVYVDGSPVYRPVVGTELQRVINSRLLLLKDRSGQIYLHIWNGYLTAPKLDGPWHVASEPPQGAAQAEHQAMASATSVDLLQGTADSSTNLPPSLTSSTAPIIYVATKPTELILFDGQPNFVPIPDTHLLYVANTTGNVFKLLTDQQTYVLISGRWFRARSLDGPWQFVPADRLTPDFADIPDSSPKENVKASVPATQQATEALIANSIPESTAVPRITQMQTPQIDGPPRLLPIAGTPLSYVLNSGTPIVKVGENSWYACQNGVWFVATSLNGPWTAAASVPAVIYSIPPSSPLHYLTYVRVYGATPEDIYEGYTPGYLGTEVEDGVVVYGTGYDYPPWIGAEWYGWPSTWGFGWDPCWTPWDDWCFDFGFGWGCGFGRFGWWRCHPPIPWGGPGSDWHHESRSFAWRRGDTASTAGNLYARSTTPGRPSLRSTPGRLGLANGYGRAYNSRTGALAAGERARVENLHSGVFSGPRGPGFVGSQYSRSSRSSDFVRGNTTRGYGTARFYGGATGGRWSENFYGGGYSHGYSHSGGYSHGGWGGGAGHGAGGGGGHSGGGGGGHGGGGGGGGHR